MEKQVSIVPWDTPFFESRFPSVLSILQSDGLSITVRAGCTTYRVVFPLLVAYRVTDEQLPWGGPSFLGFQGATGFVKNSSWIGDLGQTTDYVTVLYNQVPNHYVIFGGDWIVEVLSTVNPIIEEGEPEKKDIRSTL